jgi:hypothetical protein
LNNTTTLQIIENLRNEGLDLNNLSENQIIRIEKKLKARIKLDQSLDINEVEAIIHLLRTQAINLELFFHDDFNPLRKIIQNKDYVIFSKDAFQTIKAKGPELKSFLGEFFSEELISYARKCTDNIHYRALYHFLHLRDFLDDKILDTVRHQVEQRFLLLSETFRLYASKKVDKIEPLLNPYFYRCVNLLNRDAIFEGRIMDFQNLIIEKENHITSRLFVRLIFSLTHYLPVGEHNKDIIKQNHSYSISEGAYETKIKGKNQYFKGATFCNVDPKFKFNFQSLAIFIIPAIIVLSMIYRNYPSSRDYNVNQIDQRFLEQLKNTNQKSIGRKTWENMRQDDLYKDYLPNSETIQLLQFGDPKIKRSKPLEKHNDYVFNISPLEFSKNTDYLELSNITSNPVILIMQNPQRDSTFLLLKPLDQIDISFDLSKLTVYRGEGLEEIVYVDENDSTRHGLRFNIFEEQHKAALNKVYTFKNITDSKYHAVNIIEDNGSKTGITLKHKTSKYYSLIR